MSGRFAFTAGNTLTAAQLNTNIMDGIPYKMQSGTASITLTSGTWSTGTVAVTLTGFTQTPIITANAVISTTASIAMIITNPSSSGFTGRMVREGASSATIPFNFIAMQATPSSGSGS